MDEARHTLVRAWLIKAWHDLRSAHTLATATPPLLDTATYHCQQAAEKALKGLQAFHSLPPDKTHDLGFLVERTAQVDASVISLLEDAEHLTPYATLFRYPDDYMEPSRAEFTAAYEAAKRVFTHILDRLPASVHPEAH
ncbi:hypothetical protein AWN76_018180 [Rhodothermaceae bacterium RA]|nr:hypothetical protein AWN76_018180 [Rhodothermaceae bacterium RA]